MFSLDTSGIGLLIHNISALILLIVLIISWKKEIVGGVVFILAGLLYILLLMVNRNFEWYMLTWVATIAIPALLIGILFMREWFSKRL